MASSSGAGWEHTQPVAAAPQLHAFGPWVVAPNSREMMVDGMLSMAGGESMLEGVSADVRAAVDRVRAMSDVEYDSLPQEHRAVFLSFMFVAELEAGGLFVFSPIAPDAEGRLVRELRALGEVKVVFSPSFHTSGVLSFQKAFPDAIYVTDQLFSDMNMQARAPGVKYRCFISGPPEATAAEVAGVLAGDFDWCYYGGQAMFLHRGSRTLITGDQLYKAEGATCDGPGATGFPATQPAWYASMFQQLFLDPCPESGHLLPKYRVNFVKEPDRPGLAAMLLKLQEWGVSAVLACHVGAVADGLTSMEKSWAWVKEGVRAE